MVYYLDDKLKMSDNNEITGMNIHIHNLPISHSLRQYPITKRHPNAVLLEHPALAVSTAIKRLVHSTYIANLILSFRVGFAGRSHEISCHDK